jgi:hypothetical protein
MQQMLRIQIIGLALVSALVMSAVMAGSASAETALHQWLIGGKLIPSPVKVHSLGLLLLTDKTAPFGETVIHCHGYDAGTVGPHGLDLIQSITLTLLGTNDLIHCNVVKGGGCKEKTIALALALNLPWHTQLYLDANGHLRDMIVSDGNGEPGWDVTCENILGGKTTDACNAPLGSTGNLLNVTRGVETEFDTESQKANCKVGTEALRTGAGEVRGNILQESPSGEAKDKLTVAFA